MGKCEIDHERMEKSHEEGWASSKKSSRTDGEVRVILKKSKKEGRN